MRISLLSLTGTKPQDYSSEIEAYTRANQKSQMSISELNESFKVPRIRIHYRSIFAAKNKSESQAKPIYF
jgi:hypothetical protein